MVELTLPDKVSLQAATIVLGLEGMPFISAVRTILMYSQTFELPIRFTSNLDGYDMGKPVEETRNTEGEIDRILVSDVAEIFRPETELTLLSWTGAEEIKGKLQIGVFSFSSRNGRYYALDETNMWLEAQGINIDDFYINKNELEEFAQDLRSLKEASSGANAKKSNKESIHTKRVDGLKMVLATMTGITITSKEDYQSCYEAIGSPTRDEVWQMLQMADRKLYATGKDDFFKNLGEIKFKPGTGKGRK